MTGWVWNTKIDNIKDELGGAHQNRTKYQIALRWFVSKFNLIDIWSHLNPDKSQYTWKQTKPLVGTRLDFLLISEYLSPILSSRIESDQIKYYRTSVILIIAPPNHKERGPGFWKFNTLLLADIDYVANIKQISSQLKDKYKDSADKGLKWGVIKCELRGYTIVYSKLKSKLNKTNLKLLNKITP